MVSWQFDIFAATPIQSPLKAFTRLLLFGCSICLVAWLAVPAKAQRAGAQASGRAGVDTAHPRAVVADTLATANGGVADTVPAKVLPFQPDPKRSGLYSAILPGLGQAYNRQYWKIPVIYAAFGIAGYFFITDYDNYEWYRKAYIARISNPNYQDAYTGIYSEAQLQQLQSDYSKYLDMTVLYSVVGFGLQIMDAVSGAHLKNFDVSRDISLRFTPVAAPGYMGVGIALGVKYPTHDFTSF
jgi:Family of unknown function (DUF5683)